MDPRQLGNCRNRYKSARSYRHDFIGTSVKTPCGIQKPTFCLGGIFDLADDQAGDFMTDCCWDTTGSETIRGKLHCVRGIRYSNTNSD